MTLAKSTRQRFPLTKWEWALVAALGLIFCLLVGERYAPKYFGGAGDMIVVLICGSLFAWWLIDRVLWPLAVLLLSVLALCGAALVVAFWALLGLLNVAGAAWRGELGPLPHEKAIVAKARERGEHDRCE